MGTRAHLPMDQLERIYPKPFGLIRHHVKRAMEQAGFQVVSDDGASIIAKSGASLLSWGDRMSAELSQLGANVRVVIESKPSAQLFDWNKSARDIENVATFLDEALGPPPRPAREREKMAKNHRIFISFAREDSHFRDLLVGQAKNENSTFAFVDMSVKEPWDTQWKTNCRSKIKGCDGMIAIVTPNTYQADGARWEIQCAKEEKIPLLGMYATRTNRGAVPPELSSAAVIDWTWEGISKWLTSI